MPEEAKKAILPDEERRKCVFVKIFSCGGEPKPFAVVKQGSEDVEFDQYEEAICWRGCFILALDPFIG